MAINIKLSRWPTDSVTSFPPPSLKLPSLSVYNPLPLCKQPFPFIHTNPCRVKSFPGGLRGEEALARRIPHMVLCCQVLPHWIQLQPLIFPCRGPHRSTEKGEYHWGGGGGRERKDGRLGRSKREKGDRDKRGKECDGRGREKGEGRREDQKNGKY